MEEADESETVSITWRAEFGEVREYTVLYKPSDFERDVWSVVLTTVPQISLGNLLDSYQYTMQVLANAVNGEVYASNMFNFKSGKGTILCLSSFYFCLSHSHV